MTWTFLKWVGEKTRKQYFLLHISRNSSSSAYQQIIPGTQPQLIYELLSAHDVMAEPRSPAETDGLQSWKHLPPDPLPKCLLTPALLRRAHKAFQDMDCPSFWHSHEPLPQHCLWKSSSQAPSVARLWGGDITTKSQLWHSQTAQPSNGIASHTI